MAKHIVHMIDTLAIGGAQKLLITFGHEAQKRSLQTEVICISDDVNPQVKADLQALGVRVSWYSAEHLFDYKQLRKLFQHLKKSQPDVIQTHLTYSNIIGGLVGFALGIPVVATLHSVGKDRLYSRLREYLESWVIRYLDRAVIAVGQNIAQVNRRRLGNQKIHIVLNAVNDQEQLTNAERIALRREIAGDSQKKILITVGRMALVKAYDDLIRSFGMVRSSYENVILVLAGDGVMKSDWEKLSTQLGLSDAVKFLGSREDVPRLLAASDLYVSSSVIEGMPLSVMEAMAAGLPVVATNVGDLSSMINPDCGILVPPRQPPELANAILQILSDEQKTRTMGNNARGYALDNFSSSAWLDRLQAIYDGVRRD